MRLEQKGFSLVSVLIAAAVMGLLATNFAMYMKNSGDAQRGLESRGDAFALQQTLMLLLNNPVNCQSLLSSGTYSPTASISNITQIGTGTGFSIISNTNYAPNVDILNISFSAPTVPGVPSATAGATDYVANLIVRVATSNRELNLNIPLSMTSNDITGAISSCTSGAGALAAAAAGTGVMTQQICNAFPGATYIPASNTCNMPAALLGANLPAIFSGGVVPIGTIVYVP
jgi:hypothetical protein